MLQRPQTRDPVDVAADPGIAPRPELGRMRTPVHFSAILQLPILPLQDHGQERSFPAESVQLRAERRLG